MKTLFELLSAEGRHHGPLLPRALRSSRACTRVTQMESPQC